MRRIVFGSLVIAVLIGVTSWADAGVSVQLGINLAAPPLLVPISGAVVAYAPAVDTNYFFYGGQYYVYVNSVWYVSPGYNGPWGALAPGYVPAPLLSVPIQYYRTPPPAWHGWRRDAPPRWEPRWGRQWKHPEPSWEGRRWERREPWGRRGDEHDHRG